MGLYTFVECNLSVCGPHDICAMWPITWHQVSSDQIKTLYSAWMILQRSRSREEWCSKKTAINITAKHLSIYRILTLAKLFLLSIPPLVGKRPFRCMEFSILSSSFLVLEVTIFGGAGWPDWEVFQCMSPRTLTHTHWTALAVKHTVSMPKCIRRCDLLCSLH